MTLDKELRASLDKAASDIQTDSVTTARADIGGIDFEPDVVETEEHVKSQKTTHNSRYDAAGIATGSRTPPKLYFKWEPAGGSDVTSDTYATKHTAWAPPLHYPPGFTPVLSVHAKASNDTSGGKNQLRVHPKGLSQGTQNHEPVQLLCTGTYENVVSKEVYLGGPFEHNSAGDDRSFLLFDIDGKTGDTETMTIHQVKAFIYLEAR